jgi:hypothetical protein
MKKFQSFEFFYDLSEVKFKPNIFYTNYFIKNPVPVPVNRMPSLEANSAVFEVDCYYRKQITAEDAATRKQH